MNRPQVLVFIDWYKPFYRAGGPVRSMVNLVDHLHEQLDMHIVTGDREYMEDGSSLELPTDQWVTQDQGERVLYASPSDRSIQRWREILTERTWDVIYINGLYSRWSTIVPLWILRGSSQRRIVAVRGMLAPGPMRQAALKKRIFLRIMKALGCFTGVEFQATNEEEVLQIKRWMGAGATVHHVPNMGRLLTASGPARIEKHSSELRLVSVARIAMEKNTLFAIERLKALNGRVRLDLYGTVYDEAYWRKCQAAIAALPANIVVQCHGPLNSDEVADALSAAHALIMPSVGENFGHAILESFAVGRPVIISDRTPWKDLPREHAGWDLPLAHPELFEEALNELAGAGQDYYDQLMNGAFGMAQRSLSDPTSLEKNLALFSA